MVDKTLRHGYNEAITGWRMAMPKYLKREWNGCSISVRPIGYRRVFRCWPYFVGDEIHLKLTIKQGERGIQPDMLFCNLKIPAGNIDASEQMIGNIEVSDKPNQKLPFNVHCPTISWPCSGQFTIHDASVGGQHQPIMTFLAYPSEKLVFWGIGLISGVAGASITGILMWLLG